MLRVLVGISLLISILIFAGRFFNSAEIASQFEASLRSAEKSKKPVTLLSLLETPWQRAVIGGERCDLECYEKALGFSWKPVRADQFIANKDFDLWVFASDNEVVHYRLFPSASAFKEQYIEASADQKVIVYEDEGKYLALKLVP